MSGRAQPLARLDLLFTTARIAHEAIFDLHGKLAALGAADDHTRKLLGESAHIVLEELPAATLGARRLAARWDEQSLLDPGEADRTLEALDAELGRLDADLRGLRARQQEIARDLRVRVTEAGKE